MGSRRTGRAHLALSTVWGENGQGLVEYGLLIVLLGIALVMALTTFGGQRVNLFETINAALAAATAP